MHKFWMMFLRAPQDDGTTGGTGGGGTKPTDSFDDDDDPEGKGKGGGKEGDMIPRARFNEAQRRNRERIEALQRQVDQLAGKGAQPESKAPTLGDLEQQLEALQDEREAAIFDGERDKAKTLSTKIRQLERYLREQQVETRATSKASEAVAQREYVRALDRVYQDHPELNDKSEDYNEKLATKVARYVRGAIADGASPADALSEAVEEFFPKEKEDPQAKRDRNARESALSTANRQPPASGKGGKAPVGNSVGEITEARLREMSDKEKRILRGDIVE